MKFLKKHIKIMIFISLIPVLLFFIFIAAASSIFITGATVQSESSESMEGAMGENLPEGMTYSTIEICVCEAYENGVPASILIGQIIMNEDKAESNDFFLRGKEYENLQSAVNDYVLYITTGKHAHLKLLDTSEKWIKGLRDDLVIDDTYSGNLLDLIKSYNLVRFDWISKQQLENMMKEGDGKATGDFIWPLPEKGIITSYFGDRVHPLYNVETQHTGTDIAVNQGTAILAADGGTVIFSGWLNNDGGYTVIIDHGNNIKTQYCHIMEGGLLVTKGQKVLQGQQIAKVGSTGASTGSHLHFAVIVNNKFVNGLDYVKQPYI